MGYPDGGHAASMFLLLSPAGVHLRAFASLQTAVHGDLRTYFITYQECSRQYTGFATKQGARLSSLDQSPAGRAREPGAWSA